MKNFQRKLYLIARFPKNKFLYLIAINQSECLSSDLYLYDYYQVKN